MPILSMKEPAGTWRGPAYEDYGLDGELVEIAHNAIAAGIRIRSIGRHTVMVDPAKRDGMNQAYLTHEEVMAYKSRPAWPASVATFAERANGRSVY